MPVSPPSTPSEAEAEGVLNCQAHFLCLITPLCSYLHGGLYGGSYGRARIIRLLSSVEPQVKDAFPLFHTPSSMGAGNLLQAAFTQVPCYIASLIQLPIQTSTQ